MKEVYRIATIVRNFTVISGAELLTKIFIESSSNIYILSHKSISNIVLEELQGDSAAYLANHFKNFTNFLVFYAVCLRL